MTDTSIRTTAPPGQASDAAHKWTSPDGVAFELWIHNDIGFILADSGNGFKASANVAICGHQMSVVWHGGITTRPQAWLNAQRSIAERGYFGGPGE